MNPPGLDLARWKTDWVGLMVSSKNKEHSIATNPPKKRRGRRGFLKTT